MPDYGYNTGRSTSHLIHLPNEGTTGTTLGHLAKPTTANPTSAVITAPGDMNALGVVVSGAGTSGECIVQVIGEVLVAYDGTTTAGNFAQCSATQAGKVTDAGSVRPTRGKIVGRIRTTNVGAGTYPTILFGIGVQGGVQTEADGKIDSQYLPGGVSSVFTRTGAVVAATNDYTWAQINKTTSSLTDIATRDYSALQNIPSTFAPSAHIHAIGDVTNLQTSLDGKALASHTHAAADIVSGQFAMARLAAGVPNGLQFIRDDGALAIPPSGSGSPRIIVPLVADAAALTWTNMPAALTFFNGSYRYAQKLDLTDYTQVRMVVNKQVTAGAAAAIVRLIYRTAFDTTVTNWAQIGQAAQCEVAVNVTNTVLDTGWITLATAARADVFVALAGVGGDAVIDPAFGSITAQFK